MKKIRVKYKQISRLFMLIGIFIIAVYIAFVLYRYWNQWLVLVNPQRAFKVFEQQFRSETIFNFMILTLLTSLTSAIPFLSSSVLSVFNGLVFGSGIGIIMNIAGNTLGHFFLIQFMARIDLADKDSKLNKHLEKLAKIKNPYLALILGYMIPFIPSFLVDYTALDTKMPWHRWLICLILGVTPASVLYAFGGHAIIDGNVKELIVLVLFVLVLLLLYKGFEKRKAAKD
ncbi:TVP38/TMEM64 family protein [Streptococcus macacae]|uniref:SNARE-like domain protein n=1 Tax=Streptococcus macacae NCTC 11558 TaxID=764298 RepID=G5JYV3_9STRE|nr:VTT domain-containing protein [Streptococcus macacae]EHJ53162.1 SNARE-like domain protein [Streptococcus macacae NCTC 11558]SUN78210.1 membrane protein [Streptococcus macacae NCTC 11558]